MKACQLLVAHSAPLPSTIGGLRALGLPGAADAYLAAISDAGIVWQPSGHTLHHQRRVVLKVGNKELWNHWLVPAVLCEIAR